MTPSSTRGLLTKRLVAFVVAQSWHGPVAYSPLFPPVVENLAHALHLQVGELAAVQFAIYADLHVGGPDGRQCLWTSVLQQEDCEVAN